jgi:hypothetical protein
MRNPNFLSLNRPMCDPGSERMHQKRSPRMRTLLDGKLVYGDGVFTVDCAIRDISEGGAKVALTGHMSLPSDLLLIVVKHGIAYEAKVMWVNFPARGLKFLAAHPLNKPLPDELKFLRQLWSNLGARSGGPPVPDPTGMRQ